MVYSRIAGASCIFDDLMNLKKGEDFVAQHIRARPTGSSSRLEADLPAGH